MLAALPRSVQGCTVVEWLLVDDGSTDDTVALARAHGVDHVVRLPGKRGLAAAYRAGLDAALAAGADLIVHTDADNQYDGRDIAALVAPVMGGRADLVVGARPIATLRHVSPVKKVLYGLGNWAVHRAACIPVVDASSGFRALSRDAALRLNVFTEFTYTIETLIQAGRKGLMVVSVPVRVNRVTRPSRLVRSDGDYVLRSIGTIVRLLLVYRPMVLTTIPGGVALAAGVTLGLWLLVAHAARGGELDVPSLILAAIFALAGMILLVVGLIAEVLAAHRLLLEDLQSRVRRMDRPGS